MGFDQDTLESACSPHAKALRRPLLADASSFEVKAVLNKMSGVRVAVFTSRMFVLVDVAARTTCARRNGNTGLQAQAVKARKVYSMRRHAQGQSAFFWVVFSGKARPVTPPILYCS